VIYFYKCLRAAGWQPRQALIGTWQVWVARSFGPVIRWLDRRQLKLRKLKVR
jgi:hypothetical protein